MIVSTGTTETYNYFYLSYFLDHNLTSDKCITVHFQTLYHLLRRFIHPLYLSCASILLHTIGASPDYVTLNCIVILSCEKFFVLHSPRTYYPFFIHVTHHCVASSFIRRQFPSSIVPTIVLFPWTLTSRCFSCSLFIVFLLFYRNTFLP